ncbi:MAG: type III pantothenate kinase [Rickettsiales bacterium]|jgi:type III pantothenate kinase|nr:type III pantothenate kinase [Rickettsiales bacterium]
MILVFETGNTTTNLVVFGDGGIEALEYFNNSEAKNLGEFSGAVEKFLSGRGYLPGGIEIVLISSVVRSMENLEEDYCRVKGLRFFSLRKNGKNLNFKAPEDMGTDLMANVAAAIERYREYALVIDMGTATTFAVIAGGGEFLGGLIVTGFRSMGRALTADCDLLPNFNPEIPLRVVSCDTIEAMQSGLYHGYRGLLREIVAAVEREVGHRMEVLMTGGNSTIFSDKLGFPVDFDRNLTFYGIKLIYDLNKTV